MSERTNEMARNRPPRRAAEGGFTLIELLVAVTLIALLTTFLFGGFRIGTRIAAAIDSRIDRPAQVALVYDFMSSEMADAEPLPIGYSAAAQSDMTSADDASSGNANNPIIFDGEPHSLSFVTLPPAYLAVGGFHLLHLRLEPAGASRRLIVSWQSLPRGPVADEPSMLQPSILIDKLRSVEFSYYGPPDDNQDDNQAPVWLDRWTNRGSLPELIRLRLAMADGTQAPDLIVAPRLAATLQSESE